MKEEIQKLILAEIDKFHAKDNLRNIDTHRDQLLKDLLARRKYEIRNGAVTNHNGIKQDLRGDVELLIETSPYIASRANDFTKPKFVPKFVKPDSETRKKLANEMTEVLRKLCKMHCIVPKDTQAHLDRALFVFAENYLYEVADDVGIDKNLDGSTTQVYSPGDVIFAKFNESGLIGEKRFTFEDLKVGMSHLIDQERTQYARDLKEADQRELAKKLVGYIPTEKARTSTDPVKEKLQVIQRNEILNEFRPKQLPRIPRHEVEREIIRREVVMRNMGEFEKVIQAGGTPLRILERVAQLEYDSLDNIHEIKQKLKSFGVEGPAKYQGISYE